MLIKLLSITVISLIAVSCGAGKNFQQNLERLDKVYGKCDNHHRNYTDDQYKICKAQEAGGKEGDGINLTKIVESLKDKENDNSRAYISPVNRQLWSAALLTLEDYPLKNADIESSYIETDWIQDNQIKNQRCAVKIQFLNSELTATSLKTKFLCQIKSDSEWLNDNKNYLEEEKQLTLKILKNTKQIF